MIFIFTVATFYIIIVLLNMLIAIMGDIYERAVDERKQNRQRKMFAIMCEYMEVINDDDKKQEDQDKVYDKETRKESGADGLEQKQDK